MGVTLGTLYATDATGWTVFTPSGTPQYGFNTGAPASANDTMVIYVSSSTGKDPGDGGFNSAIQGSAAQPYRTLTVAGQKLRNGSPDWLLLRKTDTWREAYYLRNCNTGKSATEPQLFSCYNSAGDTTVANPATGGARPILLRDDGSNGDGNAGTIGFVTAGAGAYFLGGNLVYMAGLDIYDDKRDPDSVNYDPSVFANDNLSNAGSAFSNVSQGMLIEDCRFRFCKQGFAPSPQFFYQYRFIGTGSGLLHSGDIYSNNGALFYCDGTFDVSGLFWLYRGGSSGGPSASSTLTKVSGNAGSPATVTYSSFTNPGFNSNLAFRRCAIYANYSIYTSGGDGIHSNGWTNFSVDECLIDHNGWMYGTNIQFLCSGSPSATAGAVYTPDSLTIPFSSVDITSVYTFHLSGTANGTAGSTFTNNGQTFTIIPGGDFSGTSGDTFVCFGTGAPTSSGNLTLATPKFSYTVVSLATFGGIPCLKCSKGQTDALTVRNGTLNKRSGTGDSAIPFTSITDTIAGNYIFTHNVYHSQFADEYDNAGYLDALIDRGNIHCRPSTDEQHRRGASVSNGLYLYAPYGPSAALSNNSTIDSCVVIESDRTPGFNSAQGANSGSAAHYDRGTASITNNIIANSVYPATLSEAITVTNAKVGTVSGNIVYSYNGSATSITNHGILTYGSITAAGSGGPSSVTFTGFVDDGSGGGSPSGVAGNVLTISAITGTPIFFRGPSNSRSGPRITGSGLLADTYIVTQLSGSAGGTGTYLLVMDQRNSSPTNQIVVGGGTTFTIASYMVDMVYTTSGPGTGACAFVTPNGSGGISAISFFPTNAFLGFSPGSGYVVNNELTTNDIPGMTGFKVLVGSVRETTVDGTNKFDTAGTNIYHFVDPTRTIERYDSEVLSGPGTFAHFIGLARDNFKGNWDPRLTANVVNAWIRAGFAPAALGHKNLKGDF